MARVVLLHPHPGPKDRDCQILPLGILYVAAPLIAQGYDVSTLDQRKDPQWQETLRGYISDPETVCVGISTMTGPQIAHGLEMAGVVREARPKLPIVWGGVHPSLLPEQTAAHPLVDIACFGEGETVFPPLVAALKAGSDWRSLPGLAYKDGQGKVVKTAEPGVPDLDQIPPIPYHLFDLQQYKVSMLRSGPSLPMVTSRGCRFRCAYCYIQEFFKRTWRGLAPEKVVAEFKRLIREYDAEGVFLLDDFFFQNRKRAAEILQGLIDNDIRVNLYNANCRADFLYRSDDAYLKLMFDAGIKTLFVGTESGSDITLKAMKKDITTQQVLQVNQRLAKVGIKAVYSFMAGMPGETESEVRETLAFMLRLKRENPGALLYKVCLFVPFPGTEYFDRAVEMGCKFPDSFEGWGQFDYNHVNLSYLTPGFKDFLHRAEEISAFIDVDGKASGVVDLAARAYSKVAHRRIDKQMYGFMPELGLIKAARAFQQA
jgi:anaerobic magnesium-protoporphyrin IX monomethyl ester cyclase